MTETVVFSGSISSVVFSPYWIVLKYHRKRNKTGYLSRQNYLESHEMEWNNGSIIQRPGVKPNGIS
jgi:hypothetical protein